MYYPPAFAAVRFIFGLVSYSSTSSFRWSQAKASGKAGRKGGSLYDEEEEEDDDEGAVRRKAGKLQRDLQRVQTENIDLVAKVNRDSPGYTSMFMK